MERSGEVELRYKELFNNMINLAAMYEVVEGGKDYNGSRYNSIMNTIKQR